MAFDKIPSVLIDYADRLTSCFERNYPSLASLAKPCFLSTIATTVRRLDAKRTFVITGDIPAMWLRDSSAQVVNYLPFAKEDAALRELLEGIITMQAELICADPYANAFNSTANGHGMRDITLQNDKVWERKYEVDSLCAPILLAYQYWQETGHITAFTGRFHQALQKIVQTFECEQDHIRSPYSFVRLNCPDTDTLSNGGRGTPVLPTGMIWSGFRPSDDRCEYGYLIPANIMACIAMDKAKEICSVAYHDDALSGRCAALKEAVNTGIQEYGIVSHPRYGNIYAYETDGMGHYNLMDDANSPSLLSLPFLGFCEADDKLYQSTRLFVLSHDNPYFYRGKAASGIGSPHTPAGYVWPISIIMQALTSRHEAEIEQCLAMLSATHAGTNRMHESFDSNMPEHYTRPWFAWADTLFATLLGKLMDADFPFKKNLVQ